MKKLLVHLCILACSSGYAQDYITLEGVSCGPHGNARKGTVEYDLNPYKNRYDMPAASNFDYSVKLADLERKKADIGFPKKKAVKITGYCVHVKPGDKESCNCGATHAGSTDTHIELLVNKNNSDKKYRVVVEVTNRMRKHIFNGATSSELKHLLEGKTITVEGWLFCDMKHTTVSYADNPHGTNIERASCWEVHPATKITVN